MKKIDLKYQDLTYKIIGCAMEVHKTLGCGFLEYAYHDALKIEFKNAGLNFDHEKELSINYKNIVLEHKYRIDFLIENKIGVEIKALKELSKVEKAITINYLNSGDIDLIILLNFGEIKLKYEKFIHRKYL